MNNETNSVNPNTLITFTKDHTQIAKGIAILLMLYHHLFVFSGKIHCDYFSVTNIFGINIQTHIAYFCKICVCIFVFLSGLGLYESLKKQNTHIGTTYKKLVTKALHFLVNYWVIFLIFIPIGLYMGVYNFDIRKIILAFIGIKTSRFNGEWWFVSQYIALLFLFPCFNYILSKATIKRKAFVVSIYALFYIINYLIRYIFPNFYYFKLYFDSYFNAMENVPLILAFFAGMICAKYDVYGLLVSFFNQKNMNIKTVAVWGILIALGLRFYLSDSASKKDTDFLLVPLFIFSLTTLIYETKLQNLFCFLAKHSTNMWLTHTFWCYYFWQPIVFAPYLSPLIYIWLVILSVITSYVVNIIYVPLSNLLFSKEHKLSYKGYFFKPFHKKRKIDTSQK